MHGWMLDIILPDNRIYRRLVSPILVNDCFFECTRRYICSGITRVDARTTRAACTPGMHSR